MSRRNEVDGGTASTISRQATRRGLLTGAAALGAAMVARLTGGAQTAEATHGTAGPGVTPEPGKDSLALHIGTTNQATGFTTLSNSATNDPTVGIFRVVGGGDNAVVGVSTNNGIGVHGRSNGNRGVRGQSDTNIGVEGRSTSGQGVRGQSDSAAGVLGVSSSNIGVLGVSTSDIGVYGESSSANRPSVYGQSTTATAIFGNATQSGTGVVGLSTSGAAIFGQSGSNTGIYGYSTGGNGVLGFSANRSGVLGISSTLQGVYGLTDRGIGVYGEATVRAIPSRPTDGYAGYFLGRVFIDGDFTALGTKSAAIPTAKQELARVYCVEGTEAWLEDRGVATLERGGKRIEVDPEFASTINGFEVTITGYNSQNPLVVVDKDASGFRVIELNNSNSSASFSYNIWGKRKDIPNVRLAPVESKRKDEKFKPHEGPIKPAQPVEAPRVRLPDVRSTPLVPTPGGRPASAE